MKKLITIFVCCLTAAGCHHRVPVSNEDVSFALEQSHSLIKPGESVTFTAHATGVAGREEDIKWRAKGGDLELLNDEERHAQVTFKKPGVYAVVASLYVDGQFVDEEQATVEVEPLT